MHSELNLCDILSNKWVWWNFAHINSFPTNTETQGTPNPLPLLDPGPVTQAHVLVVCTIPDPLLAPLPTFACMLSIPGDRSLLQLLWYEGHHNKGQKGPGPPPQAGGGLGVCAAVKLGAGLEAVPQLQKCLCSLLTMESTICLLNIQKSRGLWAWRRDLVMTSACWKNDSFPTSCCLSL